MDYWDGQERRTERRNADNNVAKSLGKIEATLSTLAEEFDAKLTMLNVRLDDYRKTNDQQLKSMNKAWNNRSDLYLENNKKEHSNLSSIIKTLTVGFNGISQTINEIRDEIRKLEEEIEDLEDAPDKAKAKTYDEFIGTFKKVVFTAIATGTISMIIFYILQYAKG